MSYYIGLDLGTSSVKLCLTNEDGVLLKEASRPYELLQPALGWKEIEPEIWWKQSCEAMKELLDGVDGGQIRGIGVTGQMHTLVLMNRDGEVVRPALMWNDTRTASLIPEILGAV